MNKHVNEVCKIGQGNACCRYLVVGVQGFECAKNTDLKHLLDMRAYLENIVARSINCDGKSIEELNAPTDDSETPLPIEPETEEILPCTEEELWNTIVTDERNDAILNNLK